MTDSVIEPIVVTPDVKKPDMKPDMTKVREAKKRKQQERDTTLSDLQSQIGKMAQLMKTDLDDSDGPVVVTKKQKVEESGPSLKSEIFKTAMVGVLGVATWYVQSVMFAKKTEPLLSRINPPVVPAPSTPSPQQPSQKIKKIGASGLLE